MMIDLKGPTRPTRYFLETDSVCVCVFEGKIKQEYLHSQYIYVCQGGRGYVLGKKVTIFVSENFDYNCKMKKVKK